MNKNKSKIEMLNKTYESRAKMSMDPQTLERSRLEEDTIPRTYDYLNLASQKKVKKYSQRHKDKIMGNSCNK